MQRYKDILFWAGISIGVAGYLIGQSTKIPPMLRIVSPDYIAAIQGKDKIFSSKILVSGDVGFSEIAKICHEKMDAVSPMGSDKIIRFEYRSDILSVPMKEQRVTPDDATMEHQIGVTLQSNGRAQWGERNFLASIERLKDGNIFLFGALVSVCGWGVTIFSWKISRTAINSAGNQYITDEAKAKGEPSQTNP